MPAPERRDRLQGRVTLHTGDVVEVDLTPVGLDADGLMVYAPPHAFRAEHIRAVWVDVIPARSVVDLTYSREGHGK